MGFLANELHRYLAIFGIPSAKTTHLLDKIAEFRKKMTPRELEIVDVRIVSDNPVTLQEIGDRCGLFLIPRSDDDSVGFEEVLDGLAFT